MDKEEILKIITYPELLRFDNSKISYYILKPNSARNYNNIVKEILKKFDILGQYAIKDYNNINEILHINQPSANKYLLPISRYYLDNYGNYGILILVSAKNVSYPEFCLEICNLKKEIRKRLRLDYYSLIFDISKINLKNENQTIEILTESGKILKKDSMNQKGTFMIFSINEIHSPDITLEDTINELKTLYNYGIFNYENVLTDEILENIKRYGSYEFLKDLK